MNGLKGIGEEIWLAARLRPLKVRVFDGLTTREQRRERARSGIKRAAAQDRECATHKGEPITFAQAFAKVYRQPL